MVSELKSRGQIATMLNVTGIASATDPFRPLDICCVVPMPSSGYTKLHLNFEWALLRYHAAFYCSTNVPRKTGHILPLVGAATDSCGVEAAAATYLMTPN